MLKEGSIAPDFRLKDKSGKEYSLQSFKTSYVVLYFYPKDDTPGCTIEALEFNKTLDGLKKLGATVVGISGGDDKSKQKFCEKHKLNLTLLSDTGFFVSREYGVYGTKSFMGRKYMGISRVTFIIDKDKHIIKTYEKVNPLNHAKEVVEFLKKAK